MTKENIFFGSVAVVCIVVIALISQEVFFADNSNNNDYSVSVESESNPDQKSETLSQDEAVSPNTPPVINSEISYSSTTTPTPVNQVDLKNEALAFWEAEYSYMTNMKVNDLAVYMSRDNPTTAEIFEYTTPEENEALYNNFQNNLINLTAVLEDPGVNLFIEQSDYSDGTTLVSLEYKTEDSSIVVNLVASSVFDPEIRYISDIQLNGENLKLLDGQLWSEIRAKSDERYFNSLDLQ